MHVVYMRDGDSLRWGDSVWKDFFFFSKNHRARHPIMRGGRGGGRGGQSVLGVGRGTSAEGGGGGGGSGGGGGVVGGMF
jgi:hypothetical protein